MYTDVLNMFGEQDYDGSKKMAATAGQRKHAETKTLDEYGTDLTELAMQGKLDPVIGRENEIQRVVQILSRRTKNNPVLIGEPGVGKTAIAEGLAQKSDLRRCAGNAARKKNCCPRFDRDDRRHKVPRRF